MPTAIHPQSASLDLGRLHPAAEEPIAETRPAPVPVPDRIEREIATARAREVFCAELVAQRHRVGLTLDALSAATKINASLFTQLERGDLSHWPRGIYRRSFFRDYSAAIGLDPDETMTRFRDLFPDLGAAAAAGHMASGLGRHTLRLTLAPEPVSRPLVRPPMVAAAAIDGAAVVGCATLVAYGFDIGLFVPLGVLAVAYSVLSTAFFGRSPAAWWIAEGAKRDRDRDIRKALRAVAPASRPD